MSIAQFSGTLKSKRALMIFDRHANLKYKYVSRNFWRRGYGKKKREDDPGVHSKSVRGKLDQ